MNAAGDATGLGGRAIAMLVAPEGVEQIELTDPWRAVQQTGGRPTLVSTHAGTVQAFNHLDRGGTFEAEAVANAAAADDYDALVLPGGVANPDMLRTDADAVAFVRAFFDAGKPVAVICHGPWTLIEADAVRGRAITSWPSLRTDLRNAGAEWADQEVVVCDHGPNVLVSSRKPDDLPAFCSAMVRIFAAAGTG
ncbi:type 1 glutamine amidotransferase domain-containing protein [Tomitella gaofuii]|uniref:type 1 glutamine amidotransferase domain-containing protein n=1 Tax=Tomitella gaofuii TaxID=2760083 RepID=UPI0015FB06A9|nr:type 1 glutamine amidotransferase domain-containing protein [Tomitella gaofuii]